MTTNKIILVLIVIVALIFIFTMYTEYAKQKAEQDRINLASQAITQFSLAGTGEEGDTRGFIGGFLSGLPLIGGLY